MLSAESIKQHEAELFIFCYSWNILKMHWHDSQYEITDVFFPFMYI